jgi:hypothetical protein
MPYLNNSHPTHDLARQRFSCLARRGTAYKVDADAIAAKVKQEFAAKDKRESCEEGRTQAAI